MIVTWDVFGGRQTTLSAIFYSSTEVFTLWRLLNKTIPNSTEQMQTLERRKIEILVYNTSIECEGYIANLTIRSPFRVGYVLLVRNTFGESKNVFDTVELFTPGRT